MINKYSPHPLSKHQDPLRSRTPPTWRDLIAFAGLVAMVVFCIVMAALFTPGAL